MGALLQAGRIRTTGRSPTRYDNRPFLDLALRALGHLRHRPPQSTMFPQTDFSAGRVRIDRLHIPENE